MKEYALTLLKVALSLFPPLASLVQKALDTFVPSNDDERELRDLVQEILPPETSIHRAVRELEGDRTT